MVHQENVQYNFGQLSQLSKVVKLLKLCKLRQLFKVRYKNFKSCSTTLKVEQPSLRSTLVVYFDFGNTALLPYVATLASGTQLYSIYMSTSGLGIHKKCY